VLPTATRLQDKSTLSTCVNGAYADTSCGGGRLVRLGSRAGRLVHPAGAGAGIFLGGHVDYEFEKPNADRTDFRATT